MSVLFCWLFSNPIKLWPWKSLDACKRTLKIKKKLTLDFLVRLKICVQLLLVDHCSIQVVRSDEIITPNGGWGDMGVNLSSD